MGERNTMGMWVEKNIDDIFLKTNDVLVKSVSIDRTYTSNTHIGNFQ